MRRARDAYGWELWDALNNKESYEIVERDDGFIASSAGTKAYFAQYKDWPEIQKKAIKEVKGKVLDVGCGAGRVCLYLQKKGFKVTGIDNSPLAIKVCKSRMVREAIVRPIEQVDKFKSNSFDTIVMFGNNFGLLCNPVKAKIILKKMHKVTSHNAIIIAESGDPYRTKDPDHLSYHKRNRARGRMGGQLRIRVRFRAHIGEWFEYLIASKKEMKSILEGTGWRVRKFIDSGNFMYVAIIEKIPIRH